MQDMKAAQSGNEKNSSMDPAEQAARASETAASEFAEGMSRAKDIAAMASDQAMRAGAEWVELMESNAETIQHAFQCSARLAARMTERAAGQIGRTIGVSEEGADEAAQKSSRNLEAVVQSGTALSEIA